MNAAWGGIADDDEIYICLAEHKTTKNLAKNKDCTISIGTKETVKECDYFGIVSGNTVKNKIAKAGLTISKAKHVNAPIINELPLTIECRLEKIIDDYKYFFKIINVSVDESILTNGKIDLDKIHPIAYDPQNYGYYELGNKVGQAFKDGIKYK